MHEVSKDRVDVLRERLEFLKVGLVVVHSLQKFLRVTRGIKPRIDDTNGR